MDYSYLLSSEAFLATFKAAYSIPGDVDITYCHQSDIEIQRCRGTNTVVRVLFFFFSHLILFKYHLSTFKYTHLIIFKTQEYLCLPIFEKPMIQVLGKTNFINGIQIHNRSP